MRKNNFLSSFIDLIFPKICFNCRQRIDSGIICKNCLQELVWLENVCSFCGSPLTDGKCLVCSKEDFYFHKARSVYSFNRVVKNFIHDLKYEDMICVADFLAEKMVDYLLQFKPFKTIDILAPVPLHKVRNRQRGFNQSEMLTKNMAKHLEVEHIPNLIIRNRFTRTQTQLGKTDRKKNVNGAFDLNKKYNVAGKNVLIIDDVFTTGSTLNSISQVLRSNQVEKVFAFTLARA